MGSFGNLTSKATAPRPVARFRNTVSVTQSFALDQKTGEYYAARTTAAGDLYVHRCSSSGVVLATALLKNGGHGNNIALENVGTDVYIWLQWGASGTDGPLVRFRWRSGTYTVADAEPVHDFGSYTGRRTVSFAIDQAADAIGVRYQQGSTPIRYELRRLSDYKAGTGEPISVLTYSQGDLRTGAFQGFAVDGGSGFLYEARGGTGGVVANDTSCQTLRFEWDGGGVPDVMETYKAVLLWDATADRSHIESEGVQVVRDERGNVSVLLGISTGPSGARVGSVYAYDPTTDDIRHDSSEVAEVQTSEGWRYFATTLNGNGTETPLAGDLPLDEVSITRALSDVDALTATIPVEKSYLEGSGRSIFTPWQTAIYAECDGVIRAGAIVTDVDLDGPKVQITAEGFAGYLHGLPFTSTANFVQADPFDIVRRIWAHAQAFAGGNLGVDLSFDPLTTPIKLGRLPVEQWPQIHDGYPKQPLPPEGTPFVVWWTENGKRKERYGVATRDYSYPNRSSDPAVVENVYLLIRDRSDGSVQEDDTNEGLLPGFDVVGVVDVRTKKPKTDEDGVELAPYSLNWWETFDLGETMDSLASDNGFEWTESHEWLGEKILHGITYAYPTLGRRRPDLRFVLGENVTAPPVVEVEGDDYADTVYVLGSGEGKAMIRGEWDSGNRPRLRRVKVVTDKLQTSKSAADKAAVAIHGQMTGEDIKTLVVRQHENAPLGSWNPGDRIFVQGSGTGWASTLDVWLRVMSYTIDPKTDTATLTVTRSERSPQ